MVEEEAAERQRYYATQLPDEDKERILGGQANLWTEHVADAETAEYMLLPRLAAMAECLW